MPDERPTFPMGYLQTLRFPQLFVLLGILFLADLVVPDMIPFLDEVLLGLLTLMVGALRRPDRERSGEEPTKPPEKNVTPRSS